MPRLSIVIVSYNSRSDLEALLASLTRTPPRIDHEVVIVDNASSDGTSTYLREHWPGIRLIEAGANLGFAKANNLGIRQTFGSLVLLLNPDTVVPPGALDRLAEVLDSHPDVAIVGPRIVDADGRRELSFGPMISPLAELFQKALVVGNDRRIALATAIVNRRTRRTRTVDWVSGACLLVRRADLEAAGLLDERYFLYTEDVDLCAAVRARHREILFTADVEIVHRRGGSAASVPRETRLAYRRSHLAFYEKHHPGFVPLLKAYLWARGELPDTTNRGQT